MIASPYGIAEASLVPSWHGDNGISCLGGNLDALSHIWWNQKTIQRMIS